MYEISKRFDFHASHQVRGLPNGHKCGRLHGHGYVIELVLRRDTLDSVGFVVDYGDLAPFKRMVDETLDHRHLNDVIPVNPTAENLAAVLYQQAAAFGWPVARVGVSETAKTWAWFAPGDVR